jgi:hypothetical protein
VVLSLSHSHAIYGLSGGLIVHSRAFWRIGPHILKGVPRVALLCYSRLPVVQFEADTLRVPCRVPRGDFKKPGTLRSD